MELEKTAQTEKRIYNLGKFQLMGISMTNALPGDPVQVLTKATVLSDAPIFHQLMKGFAQEVDAKLLSLGLHFQLAQSSNFALIVDRNQNATLYYDCIECYLEVIAKRAVKEGDAVWLNDIGDVRRGSLRFPELSKDQKFIICIRYQWKFLLIFDLTPELQIDIAELDMAIGFGLRRLFFEDLYRTIANEQVFNALVARGWFPFNELLGSEFDTLQNAISSNFNVSEVESSLVAKFTSERLALMSQRWWGNPQFQVRRELLTEGIKLFSEERPIPSLKTLLTEIEGILRERHVARSPGRQSIEKVLSVAFEDVLRSAGTDTIYFPNQFVDYIRSSVFAHFDPEQPTKDLTRNTVGHGRAPGEAYTAVRALQIILVLDQINRYLTLPTQALDEPE